jgi:hypothetical protein
LRERSLRRESESGGKQQAGNARAGHVDLSWFTLVARARNRVRDLTGARERGSNALAHGQSSEIEVVDDECDWLCKN